MYTVVKINRRYNVQFEGHNLSAWMYRTLETAQIVKLWLDENYPQPTTELLKQEYANIARFTYAAFDIEEYGYRQD